MEAKTQPSFMQTSEGRAQPPPTTQSPGSSQADEAGPVLREAPGFGGNKVPRSPGRPV